jgi:hypothetical protein
MNILNYIVIVFVFSLVNSNLLGQSEFYKDGLIKKPLGQQWDNLKGNIKSYTQKKYSAKEVFGELKTEDLGDSFLVIFNKTKKIVNDSIVSFISGNSDFNRTDNNKYCVEIFENYISSDKFGYSFIDKIKDVWIFDLNGNIIEFKTYENNILVYKEIQTWNKNNSLIEYKNYRRDGSLIRREQFVYDSKGNLIDHFLYGNYGGPTNFQHVKHVYRYDNKEIEYSNLDELGNINFCGKFFYNSNGYLIKKIITDNRTKVKDTTTYKYDSKGNKIEEFDGSWRVKFSYDNKNKLIEIIYFTLDNEIKMRENSTYDNFGNLITHLKTYESLGGYETSKIKFDYDMKGNCIREVIETKHKPNESNEDDTNICTVIERIISYY